LHLARQHARDFRRQFRAVPLGEFQCAPRVGVLVRAAEFQEHGGRAGVRLLDVPLRESGVVAADYVELSRQRGVVAGVAEHHRAQPPVRARDLQHRDIRVRRARPVHPDLHPARRGLAAVHREVRLPVAEPEVRRRHVLNRRAHYRHQVVGQLLRIALHHLLIVRAQIEQQAQVVDQQRAGVGMGGVQQDVRPVDPIRLLDARRHRIGDGARQPDQVRGDDRGLLAGFLPDDQRLRFQVEFHSLGRVGPAGVAGKIDRLLGRDHDGGHPRLISGGAQQRRQGQGRGRTRENSEHSHRRTVYGGMFGCRAPPLFKSVFQA
jgi:hypothetical protein